MSSTSTYIGRGLPGGGDGTLRLFHITLPAEHRMSAEHTHSVQSTPGGGQGGTAPAGKGGKRKGGEVKIRRARNGGGKERGRKT